MVPGTAPGSTVRNAAVAAASLLLIAVRPLVAACVVATNRGGAAESVSAVPGIGEDGGAAGAVALVGGLVVLAAIGATLLGGGLLGDGGQPAGSATTNGSTGDAATVEVVGVVDGDTMDIEYRNGTGDRVRLLGVDTPEVHTAVSPDEYEGVPDSEPARRCLRDHGHEASAFAERELSGETVQIRFDEAADRRGSFDRLLAYVVDDGVSFNHRLLERGHARVFDSAFSESARFYRAESAARETQTGVWSCQDA